MFARLSRPIAIAAAAVVAAIAVTGSAVASPTTATPTCSKATLRGVYLFAGNGWSVTGGGAVPLAFAGSERFDGTGGLTGTSTSNFNGVASPRAAFTGTYSVNADCTGAFTINGTLHFDLYLDPSGDSFAYVQTDPGSVSATTENRATRR
ncbi:hypothetical protein [Actinokineospora enzanensis]|uniref:hypothetical protein n=1 Tax=Actinokineospora enzanensis TaxID=155975 RepID=UPI000379DEC8|nr:hypothetical protein [Actinokineospora enzanensis]